MRITQRSVAQTSLQGLNRNLEAVQRLQQQLTSGKTINKPSDSPIGANKSMQLRQDQAAVEQYARNITDGTGLLDSTDSTLQSALSQVRKARDLTVQASNSGSLSRDAKEAIRTELLGIRKGLLDVANTTVNGNPIFGGVTTGQEAYDADGGYVGVGGAGGIPVFPVHRRVSDSTAVRVDITGPEAFGDPARGDLFALVGTIADDVVAPDPPLLAGDLAAQDTAISRMLTAVADVGTRAARLEQAAKVNSDQAL